MFKFTPNPNATLPVQCPECAYVSDQQFFQLEKTREFSCPGCSKTVTITGNAFEAFREAIRKATGG